MVSRLTTADVGRVVSRPAGDEVRTDTSERISVAEREANCFGECNRAMSSSLDLMRDDSSLGMANP